VSKNVAVFVDVANIFYAAKAAGVDIDYVTLLKSATAGRDLVRAYAYTGLDPDNENQRNFHDFLRRSNYKVVSKDIRKYGDGKVKANLDIELVVDMMKTARNLDIAIVVSGDGDFAPAIRAVQEQGVRVEVISFRGNTSSDLIDVADLFTDIVQLARVEKGSRSGRRVAEDDADLSMTEVPDKLTEGTGLGRGGRGRGRGRGPVREEEPVVAARGRTRSRTGVPVGADAPVAASSAGLVALPGERLARAGGLSEADLAAAEVFTIEDVSGEGPGAEEPGDSADRFDDGEPRRRRRRGGRGRGRGRGRTDEPGAETEEAASAERPAPAERPVAARPAMVVDEEEEDEVVAAPRAPRATPFGSVWDSQLGTPAAPTKASLGPVGDDEDFDEPEIPEYLIAEQRRGANRGGGGGGGRGVRGGRSAYQSAMERERYGRGGAPGGAPRGGGSPSRGVNRYPDVSGRPRPVGPGREDRGYSRSDRDAAPPQPRNSAEPWSDVPPELEALLRAQVAQKPAPTAAPRASEERYPRSEDGAPEAITANEPLVTTASKPRAGRKPSTQSAGSRSAATAEGTSSSDLSIGDAGAPPAKPAPKRRPSRAAAMSTDVPGGSATEAAASAKPPTRAAAKPRATRKPAPASSSAAGTGSNGSDTSEVATVSAPPAAAAKRRTTRKAASPEAS
jgi:uncharacterized LabA/DUF88 family protein